MPKFKFGTLRAAMDSGAIEGIVLFKDGEMRVINADGVQVELESLPSGLKKLAADDMQAPVDALDGYGQVTPKDGAPQQPAGFLQMPRQGDARAPKIFMKATLRNRRRRSSCQREEKKHKRAARERRRKERVMSTATVESSSLATELRSATGQAGRPELRVYVDLLRKDDPNSLPHLLTLMGKLGRSQDVVDSDRKVLDEIPHLRATIAAGRDAFPSVEPMKHRIRKHVEESKRIADAREAERRALWSQLDPLESAVENAQAAVSRLNDLRAKNEEILFDEPAATNEGLGEQL